MTTLVDERVDIFFDLTAVGGDFFTLDHVTKGRLDNTEFKLAGVTAVDVTCFTQSVSVSRGRSRELDEVTVGSMSLTLTNYDGRFAPDELSKENVTYGGEVVTYDGENVFAVLNQYYGAGNIVPGRQVRWSTAGQSVFVGNVTSWRFNYDEQQRATVTVNAEDPLGRLSRAKLNAWTTTAGQTAGQRIGAIMDRPEIDWGASRDLDAGVSTLQGDSVARGTNPLTYAQLVARSDLGRFFADRNGVATFRDRHNLVAPTSVLTFSDDLTSTPDGIPFRVSAPELSDELLYSDVSVERGGGTEQTVSDAASRKQFGIRRLDVDGVLLDSDSQALSMAEFLNNVYRLPQFRLDEISVTLDGLSPAKQAKVTSLDLADVVTVEFMPRGVQAMYSGTFVVEGVDHSTTHGGGHQVSVSLSPIPQAEVFVLDDPELGVLGSGVLAF